MNLHHVWNSAWPMLPRTKREKDQMLDTSPVKFVNKHAERLTLIRVTTKREKKCRRLVSGRVSEILVRLFDGGLGPIYCGKRAMAGATEGGPTPCLHL